MTDGGVFATGDRGTLGFALCGGLRRVRLMREWSAIPTGAESPATLAAMRIDTISSTGLNALYESEDKSNITPQRIYTGSTVPRDGVICSRVPGVRCSWTRLASCIPCCGRSCSES